MPRLGAAWPPSDPGARLEQTDHFAVALDSIKVQDKARHPPCQLGAPNPLCTNPGPPIMLLGHVLSCLPPDLRVPNTLWGLVLALSQRRGPRTQ